MVIKELGGINCIYTQDRIESNDYAVDHFIPHAFVSHDLMWNLIPADKFFNSKKRDQLPRLDQYFEAFYQLQFQAVEVIRHKAPQNKLFEDYIMLFPSVEIASLTQQQLFDQVQPLITIAGNNGFEFMKC